jgi:ubiquinone biosynthesis monooxygenase Coq7
MRWLVLLFKCVTFDLYARAGSNNDVQEMWDQEKKHLEVMNRLQIQHRVRPTLLTPVAQIAGFGLGAVTALMGKEAAMACTEAVETAIGEHYDESVLLLFAC